MAAAAQVIESIGADIIDVNMGCPVPKIAKHNAGCSLMREPHHAARIVRAMVEATRIPVTVKMRAGWDDRVRNAPELAKAVEDAGASAVAVHGRTAEQSYRGDADWDLVARVARDLSIPVLGSGDCTEPEHIVERMDTGVSGVLVGRGVLRNPWVLAQATDLAAGRAPRGIGSQQRAAFLLEYIDLLLTERVREAAGFRHAAPGAPPQSPIVNSGSTGEARGRERWVINKLRALCSWFSKGLPGGSTLRERVNHAESLAELREIVSWFFCPSGVCQTAQLDTKSEAAIRVG
jgi:tRNA-dihydrouridine synthase